MSLSKKTVNKHNLKRAEVFAENGLCDLDVAFAHPRFVGYATDDADCCLCDHRHIKWLFAIHFDTPDIVTGLGKIATGITRTEEVDLAPVGSKCITDWLDAVPETAEKLEALKRWKAEMDKCKTAMKAKVIEDLAKENGYESPKAAFAAYLNLGAAAWQGISWYDRKMVKRNAWKIKHATLSRPTAKKWFALLATAVATKEAKAASATEPTVPVAPTITILPVASYVHLAQYPASLACGVSVLLADGSVADFTTLKHHVTCPGCLGHDAPKVETPAPAPVTVAPVTLADRAEEALASPAMLARLDDFEMGCLKDILKKNKKYKGQFASDKQRNFFEKLVKKAETEPKAAPKTTTAPTNQPNPGDADYASLSGIAGARF